MITGYRGNELWTAMNPSTGKRQIVDTEGEFIPGETPTGNNRQIGEHQADGHAHHEAERADPSRYDDDGQNIGDENVSIELDGVRHDAGLYRRSPYDATARSWVFRRIMQAARRDYSQEFWWRPGKPTPERAPVLGAVGGK